MVKKQKEKKMDLGSFLQDNTHGGSWADEVEDLPTAPAASLTQAPAYVQPERSQSFAGFSRQTSQIEVPVPNEPPFTAFVGNLSFNVSDKDIMMFFGEQNVKNVRIVVDPQTQTPKGFGYVEFEDRDALVNALQMNGESLANRNVRINVAESSRKAPRQDEKFGTNWRAKPAADVERSFRDQFSRNRSPERSKFGSGFRRREGSDGGFARRTPFERRDQNNDEKPGFAPMARVASAPKPNPFGQAAPRDEYAIQQAIEARQLEKQAQKELEEQKAQAALKEKKEERPKREETLPSAPGSWRKPQSGPRTAVFSSYKGKKDDSEHSEKKSAFPPRKAAPANEDTKKPTPAPAFNSKRKAENSISNVFALLEESENN